MTTSPVVQKKRCKHGFTIIELMISVAIMALLVGMLFPAISLVRDRSTALRCSSQVRQSTMAMLAYAGDNEGCTPIGMNQVNFFDNWSMILDSNGFIQNRSIIHCPVNKPSLWYWHTYGFSSRVKPVVLQSLSKPSQTIALADSSNAYRSNLETPVIHMVVTDWEKMYVCLRHRRRAATSFFDGHVQLANGSDLGEFGYEHIHSPAD